MQAKPKRVQSRVDLVKHAVIINDKENIKARQAFLSQSNELRMLFNSLVDWGTVSETVQRLFCRQWLSQLFGINRWVVGAGEQAFWQPVVRTRGKKVKSKSKKDLERDKEKAKEKKEKEKAKEKEKIKAKDKDRDKDKDSKDNEKDKEVLPSKAMSKADKHREKYQKQVPLLPTTVCPAESMF